MTSADSDAPAAKGAAVANAQRQAATIRYIDRPDVEETFADAVSALVFDGQSLRIEFAVTRLDENNSPMTAAVIQPVASCCHLPRQWI
jgi:hypothetical protein